MKNSIFIFLLILPINVLVPGKNSEEPKYNFIKKNDGISLYYRWIKLSDKREVRELKAEFEISSTPENIVAVLKNEKLAKQWMKGTIEVNRLGKTLQSQWHNYVLYDIPWPLSNQDCIIQYEVMHEPSGKNYHVVMKGVPAFIPEKDGVTRIQHLQGDWLLSPVNKNVCRVIYTVYSGQAPKFPRWITDPIIQGNLINTMKAFKVTVEKN